MVTLNLTETQSLGVSEIQEIVNEQVKISALQHPSYKGFYDDWVKWRLTYDGGTEFIEEYLEKFSIREEDDDFITRRGISYVPAFAKAAVNDVKDAIFQRVADVTRRGGSAIYQNAVEGKDGGVDLAGTTMNSFVGRLILTELLTMSKVGVFVDMPESIGTTLSDQQNIRPYVYHYRAEDIINWDVDLRNGTTYNKLLLRDHIYKVDKVTGLPIETEERYRFMWVRGGRVLVQFFDMDSEPIDRFGNAGIDVKILNLSEIPFIAFEISDSLLKDVADYQIALLNLASSDIAYALKCNFPFYTEMFDPRIDNLFQRPIGHTKVHEDDESVSIVQAGEREDAVIAKNQEIEAGTMSGRRIPKGLEMPRFIHPSSEPLQASMAKQDELKKDIRMLIKLAVSNLAPKMASAESKSFDERSLEAGLSAIGLELEHGERLVAKYWQMYEDGKKDPPDVKYPQKYSLQSDAEKRKEASDLHESTKGHPSVTYKKETYKTIVASLIGAKISQNTLEKIQKEIDAAEVIVGEPEELNRDVELGLLDPETASKAKGYPADSVEKAKQAHAERIQRIAESQAKARGTDDLGGIENSSRDEKMNKDGEGTPSKKTRGEKK